jgi:hypothetical protein
MNLLDHMTVDELTGCWNWTAATSVGYGVMRYLGRNEFVHRIAAHLWLGYDFADKKREICHRCDNRRCFNPKHLFIGTRLDNVRDAMSKGRHYVMPRKTHCKRGHLLTPETVYTYDSGKWRTCKKCVRIRHAQWEERQKWQIAS